MIARPGHPQGPCRGKRKFLDSVFPQSRSLGLELCWSASTSACRRCPASPLILVSGLMPAGLSFSTQRSCVFQNCCDGHRDYDSQRDFEKTVTGRDPGGMNGTDEHHDGDGHAG
jgi:hypothetical protein